MSAKDTKGHPVKAKNIHYENLMLQQLLKQQQKDQELFHKNLQIMQLEPAQT